MNPVRARAFGPVAAVAILALTAVNGACRASAPDKPKMLGRQAAYQAISKSVGRPLKLKTLSLTEFPTGRGYEIRQIDGPGYFVVDAVSGEIDYAMLEEVKAKAGALKVDFKQAGLLARAWAGRRPAFKGFRYLDKQSPRQWPKKGYFTAVWSGAPPRRRAREFAKVTIDLTTGRVASFGIGDPKWTMFCLPPGVVEKGK